MQPDDRDDLTPLDRAAAIARLRRLVGRADPQAHAIAEALDGIPRAIDWAGERLRWSTAEAVLADIEALGRPHAATTGPLDVPGLRIWAGLDPPARATWLAVALMGSTATLACVESADGGVPALSALASRRLLHLDDDGPRPTIRCGPAWAHAVFAAAGAEVIDRTARAIAGPLDARLAAAHAGWYGPEGPACAATLRAHVACVDRLAPLLDHAAAARLILCLGPALDDHPDGEALLEAALDHAEAAAGPALIGAALAALARRASQRGMFVRAERRFARLPVDCPPDWRIALDRGHLALRTGHFAVAEAHLDRAQALAERPVDRLQVEAQRALSLHLRGEGEAARTRLAALAADADALGALWVAGVARWHLGASAVDGPDPLFGVATLTRAVRIAEDFGVHVARWSSRAFVARGLRRAGLWQAAADEARRGLDGARAEGLTEAEFDCAIERLELLLDAGGGDPVEARLVVLEAWSGGRRPAALRRARAALDRAPVRGPRVEPEGRWIIALDGQRVDLTRRAAARRILARLVVEHRRRPGQPVAVEALFQAGWPDTVIRPESRARRVYTAVWQLRDMGLGAALQSADGGYRLAEQVQVVADGAAEAGEPAAGVA